MTHRSVLRVVACRPNNAELARQERICLCGAGMGLCPCAHCPDGIPRLGYAVCLPDIFRSSHEPSHIFHALYARPAITEEVPLVHRRSEHWGFRWSRIYLRTLLRYFVFAAEFSDAIRQFDADPRNLEDLLRGARIFATYPERHLSVAGAVFDQVLGN